MQRRILTGAVILQTLFSSFVLSYDKVFTLRAQDPQVAAQPTLVPEELNSLITDLRDETLRNSDPLRVVKALKRLGAEKYAPAIPDMIRWITLWRPIPGQTRNEFMVVDGMAPETNHYPAIGAIASIGKSALPALVDVIQTHSHGSLESKNAVDTVMLIYKGNLTAAVEYIRTSESRSSTPLKSKRLGIAADQIQARAAAIEARDKSQ